MTLALLTPTGYLDVTPLEVILPLVGYVLALIFGGK